MLDQYFGIKELYEVILKAKTYMQFGDRQLEPGEPVLYFEKITMAALKEKSNVIMAKGGWANMPRVIWEDRSEVSFQLSEGVLSHISFSILLNTKMTTIPHPENAFYVPLREGPYNLIQGKYIDLTHEPADVHTTGLKTFIYEYDREVGQYKYYGTRIGQVSQDLSLYRIEVHGKDKNDMTIEPDPTKQYIVDYYYNYNADNGHQALIYTVKKERFNGLFTLEGKFYSKDENEGIRYTNLIYMPKVRVVSDIDLRLGERANPSVGNFTMIGLPENFGDVRNSIILEITQLDKDIETQI